MKIINFNQYKIKHKKKGILTIGIILFFLIVVLISVYIANAEFRNFFNMHILRKEITQGNTGSIELASDNSSHVYAYDKYIVVLNKNILKQYTDSGNPSKELEIHISNPIYESNNRFLCIGEENGEKIYLVSGENILWQKDVEGKISKVNVNENGYVSVIVTGTSYKTIVITYDQSGKELFKSYLSSTTAIKAEISNDNKYLAIAEIDTSGIVINSNIKIISIEKATTDPTNSVVQIYNSDTNKLISNIKYQDRNELVCMYDDHVSIISNGEQKEILKTQDDVIFEDINLKNAVVQAKEKKKGLFNNNREVVITNTQNKNESIYSVDMSIKLLHATKSNIAINLGNEVHFLNSNGWLIKKYVSNNEVNKIVMGNSIAGIVYRDKVDIIHI